MEARISAGLAALGLTPPPDAAGQLARYGSLLLEQNQVMNLTAITEPDQVADLHFLDCAALLTLGVDFRDKSLIDVGTGAGFPGLPLKILEPECNPAGQPGQAGVLAGERGGRAGAGGGDLPPRPGGGGVT